MSRLVSPIAVVDQERGTSGDNNFIWCHWADCENPGSGLHYIIECSASAGVRAGNAPSPVWWNGPHGEFPDRRMCGECRVLAFCSVQCKSYYARSHRPGLYGKLAPGINPRYR